MSTLRRLKPLSIRDKSGLISHAYNETSQCGEDGIISFIFSSNEGPLYSSVESPIKRCIVEVGSWDGHHLSNSHSLLFRNDSGGWRGVLIEADSARSAAAKALHSANPDVVCVTAAVGVEGDAMLDVQLTTHAPWLPHDFDILSIDVDGIDYHIWDSLTAFRPKVVIIEFSE